MEIGKMMMGGGGAKIASGTYRGNGTYGSNNCNTLAFPFAPKIVFVFFEGGNYFVVFVSGLNKGHPSAGNSNGYYGARTTVTFNGKTVTWYADAYNENEGPAQQCNLLNQQYEYVAFG